MADHGREPGFVFQCREETRVGLDGVITLRRVRPVESSTMAGPAGIVVVASRIERAELARLVESFFRDMVKYVVDVRRRVAAVGGELHSDGERLLLDAGSQQPDLWGANYYPGRGPDYCIEYTALINIRPSQDNRSMEIQDPGTRELVREITFELIGAGEKL